MSKRFLLSSHMCQATKKDCLSDLSVVIASSDVCADLRQQSEQSKPRVHKKRQVKLDKDGNRPEVSIYARAYNKVKAQFARIR